MDDLMTIKQASDHFSSYLNRNVTTSNITYLMQYGRVGRFGENGETRVSKGELLNYFDNSSVNAQRQIIWKEKLGDDLNWALSFDNYKEADTTKHVHRLHPYKGKFIPQLVEYFLDGHTDSFKKDVYFHSGDVILDPFCGSGTTLVQSSELGINSIGIDISAFNSLISNVKIGYYNFENIKNEVEKITSVLRDGFLGSVIDNFDRDLSTELAEFNSLLFPSPDFKRKVINHEVNENTYGLEKENQFLSTYEALLSKYNIQLKQKNADNFISKWYLQNTRKEIDQAFEIIKHIENQQTKKLLAVILSRTIRSCRATTHSDLATLKEPIITPYYCSKHGKICKPLFSILSWWERYSLDAVQRLLQFDKLRTNTFQICLTGDSRAVNIGSVLDSILPDLSEIVRNKKIDGIFSSPPYVGLIDYHEQHAYAYDLFGFKRNDELEIGPLYKGQGIAARESYVQGISDVLNNVKNYFTDDYNVFLVSNDKYELYPKIAERSKMKIVNQFKRPVLNRTEKDKGAYSETIFHMKEF